MREHRCELPNNSRLKEEIFKRFKRKQKIGNKIALDFITAVLKVKGQWCVPSKFEGKIIPTQNSVPSSVSLYKPLDFEPLFPMYPFSGVQH